MSARGSDGLFPRPRKRHERDGNVEADPRVRTRSAGFGASTHLRRWPLRLSRAATCARAVSEWLRATRRAPRLLRAIEFDFPTVRAPTSEGELRNDFFERANSQRNFRFFLLTAKQREVDIGRLFLTLLRLFTFKAHGQSTRRDGVDREHAAPPRGRRRVEGRGQRLLPRGRFPQGRGRVYQGAQGTSSRACSRVPSFESRVSRADDLRRRARRGRFDRAHLPCPRSRFPPALRLPARTPRPSPSWRRFTATAARRS